MSTSTTNLSKQPITGPALNHITLESPWKWLAAGWKDLWANASLSLMYGALFAGVAVLLFFGLMSVDMTALILVLAAGFLLLGPMLAVGLYEASWRMETGRPVTFADMLIVRTKSPVQLAYIGLTLAFMFLAWVRIASLLYAIMWGDQPFPPIDDFIPTLLNTARGAIMLALGTIIGGAIAFAVFAVSVISVPMLAHRNTDFMTAIITSIRAVRENFWPMALWAWLIALLSAFGIAFLFVGLVIVFPLVGHATWHAYRDLVTAND
ncbi:DUF2189 domain-containing protein [Pseudokordiimonas caeni]|uniref:DUF2189 domain-containing protein n=1 Tax=Pseudokordiimonas caeni TaxID=2997908 RepID=UPI002811C53E|nr:DUF2189 domain-containing protein [Pseudokordiimonas caeni]